jgi:MFS family permease
MKTKGISMEETGLVTSDTINAAATAGGTAVANCDDESIKIQSNYKALPLLNFKAYCELVTTLYGNSLAVILGNSLEWLDFSIYGYSSAEISSQLFGGSRAAFWGSFGLGFAMRPLGAYMLGKLSDEKSRKLSFIVSMLAMSTSTALMSLIPAVCNTTDEAVNYYCVSNLWTSAIPTICLRCVQGFSAGAAAGGVNVIQSELWSTTERKGAIAQSVGVQNVSGGGASMLSAGVVYGLRAAMGNANYAVWGWRLAFLIVVPPSLFASYLMHKSTPESNYYAKCDGRVKEHIRLVEDIVEDGEEDITSPINEPQDPENINRVDEDDRFSDEEAHVVIADDNRRSLSNRVDDYNLDQSSSLSIPSLENTKITWVLISVMIFSQFAISGFNNLTVFLVEFAETNYGVTVNTSTLMQVAGKAVQVLMTPFAATLGDIKGWHWTCAFGGTLCTILALPMMVAGNFGGVAAAWITVSGCLPLVSTFWILNAPLLATSVFPVDCRSRGTSMVLATAAGIAGFLPLVLEEIPNTYAQGGVLTIIAALGTIGIIWVRHQAKVGNVRIYQRPELF